MHPNDDTSGCSWPKADGRRLLRTSTINNPETLVAKLNLRASVVICLAMLLCATPVYPELDDATWPDDAVAIFDGFRKNKSDIELLREMMLQSSHVAVSHWPGGNVTALPRDGEFEDARRWKEVMVRSGISHVVHLNDLLGLKTRRQSKAEDFSDSLEYMFRHPLPVKKCENRFREVACGICAVTEDGDWTVQYQWSSGKHEEDRQAMMSKKLSAEGLSREEEERADAEYEIANDECYLKGLEEMGYEGPLEYYL